MLRFFRYLCNGIAGICAFLSPLAIFHWLIGIFGLPITQPFINMLAPFFEPFNKLVGALVTVDPMTFAGNTIHLEQPMLGILFTVISFATAYMGSLLKSVEDKVNAAEALLKSHQQQLQQTRKSSQERRLNQARDYDVYVYIKFLFQSDAKVQQLIQTYPEFNGQRILSEPETLLLRFRDIRQAMEYCLTLSNKTLAYYRLTSNGTQPPPQPYYVSLHASDPREDVIESHQHCHKIIGYASDNQILFSENVMNVLQAHNLAEAYKFQSQGMYETRVGRPEEIYRLSFKTV